MTKTLDVLLLLALPASGKSEIRRYLAHLSPEQCCSDFHLGPTVQLDDFPYVHLMRRVSKEAFKLGHGGMFFDADELPMKEPLDWGMLTELLNEDYDDVVRCHRPAPASAAQWLFDRYDAARAKVGARPAVGALPAPSRRQLVDALEKEAAELLRERNANVPDSLLGKTVVIELARGGADGSTMPLPAPYGYQYSLGVLSDAILSRAAVLYVWVTPEQSRRKNRERADPRNPGSILHHVVPLPVMMGDYGCDDMEYLIQHSERPDTLEVVARGKTWHLPVARFDDRKDKTSFVRGPREGWRKDDVKALHDGLAEAFDRLARARG